MATKKEKVSTQVDSKNSAFTDGEKDKKKKSAKKDITDTQQLSDALVRKVAKGEIKMEDAIKQQQAKDKATMKNIKGIKTTTGKGGEGNSYYGKERKPKFKRNSKGNVTAY